LIEQMLGGRLFLAFRLFPSSRHPVHGAIALSTGACQRNSSRPRQFWWRWWCWPDELCWLKHRNGCSATRQMERWCVTP